ncbi:MAG: hypothetical protein ABSG21_04145 [Spirochaetia bacterium]
MNKAVPRIATITLVLACAAAPAFAADNPGASQYSLGDQTMSINAGMFVPLFILPTWTVLLAGNPSHLTLGAVGSLSWAAYVTPQIRLGADVGGNFTLDPNTNILLMLPFVVKGTYVFTFYPFEVPLTMGIGMNIVKYTSLSSIDLLLRPGTAFYWIYNSSWSFGVNLNYWFDMQFNTNPTQTRYGNFLEFSLSALYHF